MSDLHYDVKYVCAIEPYNPATTGTKTGIVIDRAGFDKVEFIIQNGAVTTTGFSFTPVIKEGSVTGTLTSVADGDLLGTETLAVLSGGTSDNKTAKIGYTGNLRYVSCDGVLAGAATGFHAVLCALSGQRKGPQSDQTP